MLSALHRIQRRMSNASGKHNCCHGGYAARDDKYGWSQSSGDKITALPSPGGRHDSHNGPNFNGTIKSVTSVVLFSSILSNELAIIAFLIPFIVQWWRV